MECKIKPIVLGTIEAYNSTLRLKTIADIMLPCHGPGYDGRTKTFL